MRGETDVFKSQREITIKKIIMWGFIGIVLISILTTFIILIPSPFKGFTGSNDWISFYGSLFGGIIGAVVALMIVKIEFENRKKERENQNKVFHKYFIDSHLILLKDIVTTLDQTLANEIAICKEGGVGLPSYPYLDFPSMEVHSRLLELVEQGLLSYDDINTYSRLSIHISFLKQQKEKNEADKDMYYKALIEINKDLSNNEELLIKFSEQTTPSTKFLATMLVDWIEQLHKTRGLIVKIISDIDYIKNNRKNCA
jgi:hypothetical protein